MKFLVLKNNKHTDLTIELEEDKIRSWTLKWNGASLKTYDFLHQAYDEVRKLNIKYPQAVELNTITAAQQIPSLVVSEFFEPLLKELADHPDLVYDDKYDEVTFKPCKEQQPAV